ncbi:hypothetical protein V491_01878 [Pseudogymnoascus sp. VKM F-3775]|nr:hypothetical protein V491_01878 [Pseudogymnoascus sp. VKM F-3775]
MSANLPSTQPTSFGVRSLQILQWAPGALLERPGISSAQSVSSGTPKAMGVTISNAKNVATSFAWDVISHGSKSPPLAGEQAAICSTVLCTCQVARQFSITRRQPRERERASRLAGDGGGDDEPYGICCSGRGCGDTG